MWEMGEPVRCQFYRGRHLVGSARDPCAEALQQTRARHQARVALLHVTPPLLPCFLSHSSAILSIKPEKKKFKKRLQFYRVSPDKREHLDAEVKYMLENNIAEPCASSWCFLLSACKEVRWYI